MTSAANKSGGRRLSNRRLSKQTFFAGAAAGGLAALAGLAMVTANAQAQAPRLLSPPVAADGTPSLADLVERVSPAVVSVLVEREVEQPQIPEQFQEFFNFRMPRPGEGGRGGSDDFDRGVERMEAQGSGFFIDREGHVVTNNHVVEGADSVRIVLNGGDELEAEIVGVDPLTDLAVLKVKAPANQPFVQFAEDVNLRVGDYVVAVGNPFGLSGTVTSGIVSALGREGFGQSGQFTDFIQIDAPINRGNSGGPTFDLKGRVVGVNTAIYSTTGGSVGIGFAIPSKVAKNTVAQLIKNGSVTRGWLGVSIQPLTTELAAALGQTEVKGALIAEVLEGTPAAKSGFLSGDLVLTLENRAIEDPRDLTRKVSALSPGEKVKVKVLRDGKEKILNVTLGQRDDSERVAEAPEANDNSSVSADLGVRVSELNPALRQQYRVPDDVEGVIVTNVRRGSPAAEAGLRPGIVILQVDGQNIENSAALNDKIKNATQSGKEAVLLRLQMGEAKQFSALPITKEG